MSYRVNVLFGLCLIPLFFSCVEKQNTNPTHFTKLDSLTDTYLAFQDSVLQSWNTMINDDNEKIEAMQSILHELTVSGGSDPSLLKSYSERIKQLRQSRYNQKTMANEDIVEEYDFESTSLINELLTMAEAQKQFAYNTTLQKLADKIRTADQRVAIYREEYDRITSKFNTFVEENKIHLKEIDSDTFLEKRPLFQMASEE